MSNLLWGCDPEFFAGYRDEQTYDKFLTHKMFAYSPAACEKWNGLKPIMDDPKHPWYFNYKMPNGLDANIVGDGAAFELNFNQPFGSIREFYDSVRIAKEKLDGSLSKMGFSMFDQPVVNFDYHRFWTPELMSDPKFMMGVIFGCDPDTDAFDTEATCEIKDASTHPYRYGGGHIHISGDPAISRNPVPFVMLLGLFVGNYCIANSTHLEGEKVRATYYGKPGKHRVQNYKNGTVGVEYRTPSNEWTTWDRPRFEGMFDQIHKALDYLKNPAKGKQALADFTEATRSAVTTANVDIAQSVLRSI
jgi:hypothetical protein